jgi:hypothetical protein
MMARLKLTLVDAGELSAEEIAKLFEKLTGRPATAQDLQEIRDELADEEEK